MARLKSNAMLPILGGVILLTAGAVGARGFFSDDSATPQPRTSLPSPTEEPDGDTPADTIRTLNAKLEEVNQRLESVVGQNEDLQNQNEQLRGNETRLRADIAAELEQKLTEAQEAQTSQLDSSVTSLGEQLNKLKSSLTVQKADSAPKIETATDYPISGGLGGSSFGHQNYVWVQPLDAAPTGLSGSTSPGGGQNASGQGEGGLLSTTFNPEGEATSLATTEAQPITAQSQAPTVEPYFTINNLATLAGSTAFTAMIGRVPIGGQVSDPVPFRVLVGRENLAASGLRVPDDIASMVFEGVAIGDWTLGCVEGSLRAATFVFEDGTIRTVTGGDGEGQDGRLGYIADKFGTPCIAGEKVSNAGPYLTAAVGLAAGAGAAEAFAAAETAQVVDDGAVVSAVVGDAAKFALGRAASEGVGEIQQYLADRLSSTFDAVFVPPGAEVSLLIQQEITIDYEPSGRRLDYAKGRPSHIRALD